MKNLQPGIWISLYDLAPETTEQDLIGAIETRTGIALAEDQIDIKNYHSQASGAIISFTKDQIAAFLSWAFHEDMIQDRAFKYGVVVNVFCKAKSRKTGSTK